MIYFDTSQNDEAFIVNVCDASSKPKKKKWNGPFPRGTPESILGQIIQEYKDIDDEAQEVLDLSAACYNNLQSSIDSVKRYISLINCDSKNNSNILSEVRSIISASMDKKTKNCAKIIQLTCKVRSKARLLTRRYNVVIEPKHQLPNIEKCFQTLLSLYKKIVNLAKKKEKSDTLLLEHQRDLNKKISMISCWVHRWRSSMVDFKADRFSLAVLTMRHKLLVAFEMENKAMKEELEHAEILCECLSEETAVSQEIKCANEDKFNSIRNEYQVLVSEAVEAKKELEQLEGEARDLDSLYVEEAALLQNIESELKEFYEYFSMRPVISSAQQADKMSKFATKAMERLSAVAGEIDAVFSIQDIKAKLSNVSRISFNVYTSHTLRAVWSHWQNTIQSAVEMVQWLDLQKKVTSQLKSSCSAGFEKHLESLAVETRNLVADVLCKNGGKDYVVDATSTDHKVKKLERTFMKLCKMREENTSVIVEEANPLHRRGITTPQVIDLMNCWNHSIFTVLILLDDAIYQENLVKLASPTMEDMTKRRTLLARGSAFYSSLGNRALCLRENVKMDEHGEILFVPPENEPSAKDFNFEGDPEPSLLRYSSKLDPYGRITCGAWLDMMYKLSHPEIRVPTILLKKQELEHNFRLICDGLPFLKDATLKRLTRKYRGLWEYCEKNVSEYFGPESERYAKRGVKCYDYRRFICKLLGLRQKLSVNPN